VKRAFILPIRTAVKLYFPRSLESEEIAIAAPTAPAPGGTETILVAEDDGQLCETVVQMLRELGYEVLKVHDAAGALTIIESGIHVDLLFTDVVMPGVLSSPELARKAKARLPDLAVLFTSGYTQNAIVHGGRLDRGVELLSKPYTREALARKVRHVLANHKHMKQLKEEMIKAQASVLARSVPQISLRILLVEDQDLVRVNTTQLLQQLGHTVVAEASAENALTALEANVFDVLIADVGLPGASGIALAQTVRQKYPDVGVIYATGQAHSYDMKGALHLQKPYDMQALVNVLRGFSGK